MKLFCPVMCKTNLLFPYVQVENTTVVKSKVVLGGKATSDQEEV